MIQIEIKMRRTLRFGGVTIVSTAVFQRPSTWDDLNTFADTLPAVLQGWPGWKATSAYPI